ncbi:MAG: EAL domain-containing protein [Rhodococcus sp. (in: high G+C Gram-positive bacteria)]
MNASGGVVLGGRRTPGATERDEPKSAMAHGIRWGRILIGLLTISFGVAAVLLIPSGQFGGVNTLVVAVAAASTVPTALLWFMGAWPTRRMATVYVLYADLGVTAVLLAAQSAFVGMPGAAMFAIIAVFAVVGTSPRLLILHLCISAVVLAILAGMAISQGADAWIVASRTVILGSLLLTPLALRPYMRYLRARARGALRDSLTGLWNRRGLFDGIAHLNRLGAGARAEERAIGVVVIDIDRFKAINDRFGHPSGDAVLVEVANRLKQAASAEAVVSRIGGDEFVCVHVGVRTDVDDAEARIRNALEESFSGPPFTTSIGSAGGTVIRGDSTGALVRRLIATADIELYRDKNHVPTGARPSSVDPLGVRERIESLIEAGGPGVVFQPICAVPTSKVVGYEALSRFPFGHGSPMIWFRDASSAGIGVRLELAAIDNALKSMSYLPADAFVSINASAETIRSTDLLARLSPHISERTLCLEITEHERVDDYRAVARSVEGLRAAGVRISVDDVGAGFSGLRQVVELKPDSLKVDYTLVHGIDADSMRRAAAAALVGFACEVGSTLIMEGVETEAEMRVAVELGVDMVQGFYTGRPEAPPLPATRPTR